MRVCYVCVSETTPLSLCVCMWSGISECVFVNMSMWVGYEFKSKIVCVTYWLSILSRWSSLPKVPWKPLRKDRGAITVCSDAHKRPQLNSKRQ